MNAVEGPRLPAHIQKIVTDAGEKIDAIKAKDAAERAARKEAQDELKGFVDITHGLVNRHPSNNVRAGIRTTESVPTHEGSPVDFQIKRADIFERGVPVGSTTTIQAVSPDNVIEPIDLYTLRQDNGEVRLTVHEYGDEVERGAQTDAPETFQREPVKASAQPPRYAVEEFKATLVIIAKGLGEEITFDSHSLGKIVSK